MFFSLNRIKKASNSLISMMVNLSTLEGVPIVLFSDTLALQKDFPDGNHDGVLGYIHYLRGEYTNTISKESFSINVRSGQTLPSTAVTLAHECGHLKALLKDPLDGSEISAWTYAYKFLSKLKKWEQYCLYNYFVMHDPTCTYLTYKKVSPIKAIISLILNK